ncbi:hypothetical protein [Sporolactobacillus laevolacticus]|uniref:hypothetical protein n=1 Tax=Sporolactobacillus laevolacticus TaxID=33018 RepID=UPI0025B28167|nr:hypothetical protein [Sporolactobacillus laevolacticus]MDN3955930.1 hypothetical protein [Sporolactobacillus laevolacticus]
MITAKARAVDGPDKSFRVAEIKRRDLDVHDVTLDGTLVNVGAPAEPLSVNGL